MDDLDFIGEPIVLNGEGELLITVQKIYNRQEKEINLFDKDISFLHNCTIGDKESENRGIVNYRMIPDQKNIIFCRACGLRIDVPLDVETKAQLRSFLER